MEGPVVSEIKLLDGEWYFYVNAVSRYEGLSSLTKYFTKHWGAKLTEEFDVGSRAKYIMKIQNQSVNLEHDSQLGNKLSSKGKEAQELVRKIHADLYTRLSKSYI